MWKNFIKMFKRKSNRKLHIASLKMDLPFPTSTRNDSLSLHLDLCYSCLNLAQFVVSLTSWAGVENLRDWDPPPSRHYPIVKFVLYLTNMFKYAHSLITKFTLV